MSDLPKAFANGNLWWQRILAWLLRPLFELNDRLGGPSDG